MSKIDVIKYKTDEQYKARAVAEKESRAHELGFDDIEDFELWDALEGLRMATKARRRKVASPEAKIRITANTNDPGPFAA